MKFLILWAIVIIADFMLEFRFEFLWPFWLLLRSVHDSFKYKGLVSCVWMDSGDESVDCAIITIYFPFQAFSVLFVCIAITSDLICLFFIPVHWLFFAASTYVWVQYVWHTGGWMRERSLLEQKILNILTHTFRSVPFHSLPLDKGICLPTIILWMLFVYLEAAIRWKDSRHMPHLDLCRPFAAHWWVIHMQIQFSSFN